MTLIYDIGPPARRGAIAVPIVLLCGLFALAFVALADRHRLSPPYAPLAASDVTGIAFVARPDAGLRDVLRRACTASGCDAGVLHPMILASAAAMDGGELRASLAAQARLRAESVAARDAAAPGTKAHRLAALDVEAAMRMTELYRKEIAAR